MTYSAKAYRLAAMVEREQNPRRDVIAEADTGFWMAVGMDAGYLVGLEMGKRLAQGGAR